MSYTLRRALPGAAVLFNPTNRITAIPTIESLCERLLIPLTPDAPFARPLTDYSGAHQLLLAVLERGITDLKTGQHSPHPASQRIAREAWDWITSANHQYLYSFISICDALHVSPDWLRDGLRKWMPETAPPRPHAWSAQRKEAQRVKQLKRRQTHLAAAA